MTKQAVQIRKAPARKQVKYRKVCKHPGRFFNRCKNCPKRAR